MSTIDENSVLFWKQKYEELSIHFDEYQKSSRDFEQELEAELKQCEEEIKELKNQNHRLNVNNELLKEKLAEMNLGTQRQISQLQGDLAQCKAVKDEMQKYIRELEQKNDDLERTNRCAMFSLGEFEAKLNEALERNAILESELDEKDELAETVQRLRDEARDLKQELAVRQIKAQKQDTSLRSNSIESTILNNDGNNNSNSNVNLNNSSCPMETDTSFSSQSTSEDKIKEEKARNAELANNVFTIPNVHHPNPVTPSLRISALNFVGDSLRKITSMEARLLAARNLMKESNRDRRSATISSIESSSFMKSNSPQNVLVPNVLCVNNS
ncbi:unnamed protein product [Brachionus calyciflorus]|uniref:NUDE domain-containing protein n=1 Tax=Brachionus calyciflorus TaxID=104777 RepID=A0A813M679_9BILA|nr:unnamed protein product [Brachionus calyciflorus]